MQPAEVNSLMILACHTHKSQAYHDNYIIDNRYNQMISDAVEHKIPFYQTTGNLIFIVFAIQFRTEYNQAKQSN
mgnify:CR=1 FL=1